MELVVVSVTAGVKGDVVGLAKTAGRADKVGLRGTKEEKDLWKRIRRVRTWSCMESSARRISRGWTG